MSLALICAVGLAAEQGDWGVVGGLVSVLGFRVLMIVIQVFDRRAAFDLDRYRVDLAGAPSRRSNDRWRLELWLIAAAVLWEVATLIVMRAWLDLPSWAVLVAIVGVIPVWAAALALSRRRIT